MLSRKNQVPDKSLIQRITQRLARTGMSSQCSVTVAVRNGTATLSGALQYENQRRAAVTAARGVEGVRSIVDQMTVKAQTRKWS